MNHSLQNLSALGMRSILLIAVILLSACGPTATTPVVAPSPSSGQPIATPAAVGQISVVTPGKTPGQGNGGGRQSAGTPGAGTVALKISGKVSRPLSWTEDQVRAMPTAQASAKNQRGESSSYSGVLLSTLFQQAGVATDASKVVFIGEGSEPIEAEWKAVQACTDCLVSFRNRGGFSLVMPGFADQVQLKGLTAIEVK